MLDKKAKTSYNIDSSYTVVCSLLLQLNDEDIANSIKLTDDIHYIPLASLTVLKACEKGRFELLKSCVNNFEIDKGFLETINFLYTIYQGEKNSNLEDIAKFYLKLSSENKLRVLNKYLKLYVKINTKSKDHFYIISSTILNSLNDIYKGDDAYFIKTNHMYLWLERSKAISPFYKQFTSHISINYNAFLNGQFEKMKVDLIHQNPNVFSCLNSCNVNLANHFQFNVLNFVINSIPQLYLNTDGKTYEKYALNLISSISKSNMIEMLGHDFKARCMGLILSIKELKLSKHAILSPLWQHLVYSEIEFQSTLAER